jgi:hypothetical protein
MTKKEDARTSITSKGDVILVAGEILGITPGIEFDIYSSLESSWNSKPLGRAKVLTAGGVTSTMELVSGKRTNIGPHAVAIPVSQAQGAFLVRAVVGYAYDCVQLAVAQENESIHSYGRPKLSITTDPNRHAELIVDTESADAPMRFSYDRTSPIHMLGLSHLHISVPQNYAHPSLLVPRIREILQAGAHFFKYLNCAPKEAGIFSKRVEATLCELVEGDDIAVVGGRIVHPLEVLKRLDRNQSHAYEVKALPPDAASGAPVTLYGVEIINKLKLDLFAWMFFFDCSTL